MHISSKKRTTIALLIDWLNTPYHMEILSGVADYSEESDINLICIAGGRLKAPSEWERNRNVLFDFVNGERIDGLVIAASSLANYAGNSELENLLEQFRDIPMVNIGEDLLNIPAVLLDNESGIREIMKHMVEYHGYKKIAFISGLSVNTEAIARLKAYKDMLSYYGLPFNPDFVYEGNFSINSGKEAIKELLDVRKVEVDAIVSANDYMALGIIDELQMRGKIASEIIPITGYDDISESKSAKLTTVRQPTRTQAYIAAKLLHKKISGEEIPRITKMPTEIIVRESCGCYSTGISSSITTNHSLKEDVPFNKSKNLIIDKIAQTNILVADWDKEWIIAHARILIDCLIKELEHDKTVSFLPEWNRTIQEYYKKNENISNLHILLSILRRNIIPYIKSREKLEEAEDLFQEARIILGDVLQKTGLFGKILETSKLELLNDFGARLTSTFNLEEQFDIIYSELSSLGIKSCFISLYNFPENPLKEARLIFGFQDKVRLNLPEEGIAYPSKEIIPSEYLYNNRRFTYILENMFHRTSQLGFIIIEYGPKDDRMYEIIRTKINDSIMGTIMFQKIQRQADNLEQLVRERTSELYNTNARLNIEIQERRMAEEKLRKSEERFREMALFLPSVIVETDVSLKILFLNKAGHELLAIGDEDIKKGISFLDFIVEEERSRALECAEKTLHNERTSFSEFRIQKKDGTKITFLTKTAPLYRESIIEGIRWNAIDIKPLILTVLEPGESFFKNYPFTQREKSIIQYIIQGYKNKEIAAAMFIQEGTVKDHITSIFSKVGVKNREEFFEKLQEYQVKRFGYNSFIFSVLSTLLKD